MWDEVKSIIGKGAPLVGSLIGGKSGEVVGDLIANTLGVENNPKAILKELKNNPEAITKIIELERNHTQRLQGIALSKYQSQLEDTQDARKENGDHWMPPLLTIILCAMVAGMFAVLAFSGANIPQSYSQVIIMIAGNVLGAFGTAVIFWLGATMMQGGASKFPFKKGKTQ